jgi:hypothetical protein
MKKLIVFNNPCINYKYYAEIEFETGRVINKTNVTDNNNKYECFFLVSKEKLSVFSVRIDNFLDNWQPSYESEGGIVIDGFHWNIKVIDAIEKEIAGVNCKPKEFDFFINELELLLQKDFGGQYT